MQVNLVIHLILSWTLSLIVEIGRARAKTGKQTTGKVKVQAEVAAVAVSVSVSSDASAR